MGCVGYLEAERALCVPVPPGVGPVRGRAGLVVFPVAVVAAGSCRAGGAGEGEGEPHRQARAARVVRSMMRIEVHGTAAHAR